MNTTKSILANTDSICLVTFPIIATNPFNTSMDLNENSFSDLADCGINVGIQHADVPKFMEISNLIKGSSFKLIFESEYLHDNRYYNFSDNDIEENKAIATWQYFVNLFTKYPTIMFEYEHEIILNPNLGGWFFKSLTLNTNLSEVKKDVSGLATYQPEKISYTPFIYYNLESGLNELTNNPGQSLFNYFENLASILRPQVLSYSFFPIQLNNSEIAIDYYRFYAYLEAASKAAVAFQIPFWAYCLTCASVSPDIEYPIPMEGYLRFIVFSSLGYGAKGIVYEPFCQPENKSDKIFIMSPIDRDGNKTPLWHWLKNVNEDIRKYENIFLNTVPIETIHTGLPELISAIRETESYGPIKYMEYDDKGVQISFLQGNGKEYFLLFEYNNPQTN